MKYAAIDIETTGLDEKKDQILSIGIIIDDLSKPLNDKNLDKMEIIFNYTNDRLSGNIYAIDMNSQLFQRIIELSNLKNNTDDNFIINQDKNHIIHFMKPDKISLIRTTIVEFFDKHFFDNQPINIAGKNVAGFDLKFLEYNYNLSKYLKYKHRTLDPAILFAKKNDTCLPDLKECKKRAQFQKIDVAHQSLEDCYDIIQLLHHKFD